MGFKVTGRSDKAIGRIPVEGNYGGAALQAPADSWLLSRFFTNFRSSLVISVLPADGRALASRNEQGEEGAALEKITVPTLCKGVLFLFLPHQLRALRRVSHDS